MVKIRRKGKLVKVCPQCKCKFEFHKEDIITNTERHTGYIVEACKYAQFVQCPYCGEVIDHSAVYESDYNIIKNTKQHKEKKDNA